MRIRTALDSKRRIKICNHLRFVGCKKSLSKDYEYIEQFVIYCSVCEKQYPIELAVN